MKRNILIILTLMSLLSCKKDFLEVVDKTVLLKQGYVIDLTTTQQYLNGIYYQLAFSFSEGSYTFPYAEIIADNVKPYSSSPAFLVYQWVMDPASTVPRNWAVNYKIIRDCNYVLEKATEFRNENSTKADVIRGQALCIRAFMHFIIVNIYAQSYNFTNDAGHPGIPYIRTSNIEEVLSRQSVSEDYTLMIKDVEEAITLLPSVTIVADKLSANLQMAKALLARINLFKGDYLKAKNLATESLTNVPLMSVGYLQNLYTPQETEALFQLAPGNSATQSVTVFMGYYCNTQIRLLATPDIAQLYRGNPSDKRNAWVKDSTVGIIIKKFGKGTANSPGPFGDYYQTLFRSSEMALTASEAYYQLANEDSARYFVNQIRIRASVSPLTTAITGAALLDSIRLERRKEMAFDGLRMFDLLRWKQKVFRNDPTAGPYQNLPYPSNKAIAPIPYEDVIYGGLPQNAGY